jgi:hypothetical protein
MKYVVGGLGSNAKVEFDESRGKLRIWEKGWIGKRKYRIDIRDVRGAMYGMYTSKLRLILEGFNIEFNHKGKIVVVTVTGNHKRFVQSAEAATHAIGKARGLSQSEVAGARVFYGQLWSETGVSINSNSNEGPLTSTEQMIAGAARGVKNFAGEVTSDAKNAASNLSKGVLKVLGAFFLIGILFTNQILGFIILAGLIWYYKRNR